jgi:hypothetical protein
MLCVFTRAKKFFVRRETARTLISGSGAAQCLQVAAASDHFPLFILVLATGRLFIPPLEGIETRE